MMKASGSQILDKGDISELPLEEVLKGLGEKPLKHSIAKLDMEKAKMGEDLIYLGRTVKDGKKTKKISSFFVCTDCHNMTKEFDDLSSESPVERLDYANKNGLPFLPGSTLWGIYNRTSFYNKDYVKKYGSLVEDARDDLGNAVQLCSKYCSSGRNLQDWELEAIMHYFKQNEIRMKDLDLTSQETKSILFMQQMEANEKAGMLKTLNSKYRKLYDATFLPTMDRNDRKYGEGGNAENGKLLYKKACLFCHENKRVTYLHLDDGKLSAKMLWKNMKGYKDLSLYQIIRHGTYSKAGRKQYMPLYTKEKMSDAQINDIAAYIKQIAGK